jgi:hypothetical protein
VRNNDIAFAKKLIPSLGFSEGTKAGALLREGIAVRLKQLPAVLAGVIEKKIRNSKAAPTYEQLKEICDHERLAVGIKCLPDEEFEALKQAETEKLNENAEAETGANTGESASGAAHAKNEDTCYSGAAQKVHRQSDPPFRGKLEKVPSGKAGCRSRPV